MHDSIRTVHVVAKSHLDLGFTALAAEVEARYLGGFIPAAIATARELRRRGGAGLVWTTGSWILHRALAAEGPGGGPVAEAVERGDLAWHAWPVTTHTELLDRALARSALGVSRDLDARFGRTTVAAKMTDVPGHTIGLVPVLAEAGVSFLHLGVNPAWPVPDVPPVFRWVAPDGSEVAVAYQSGGYGGEVRVPGCDAALVFLHAGDNAGPPSADEVIAAHDALARRHPGAEVRASTLDAFARALVGSGAVDGLPEVRAEIGDPWLFGTGSDPGKLAGFRRVLAARRAVSSRLPASSLAAVDRQLLLVAEHTWGLDQKTALPDEDHWERPDLAVLRATPEGRRFEASWAEQRAYVAEGERLLLGAVAADPGGVEAVSAVLADPAADGSIPDRGVDPGVIGYEAIEVGARVAVHGWEIGVAPATGALEHLVTPSGRVLARTGHHLGRLGYQTFDASDYGRFLGGLCPLPEDLGWAVADNTKPRLGATAARSGTTAASRRGAWVRTEGEVIEVLVATGWEGAPTERFGAPRSAWSRWRFDATGSLGVESPSNRRRAASASAPSERIELVLAWRDKPASRFPEATWLAFVPPVAEPERWRIDKLGVLVDPGEVVGRGGRALHGAGDGLRYEGPEGSLRIELVDAPLVAPGGPDLLDADPSPPDLSGGWHVLLHDNCWGTNFPMWSEGDASFAFRFWVS